MINRRTFLKRAALAVPAIAALPLIGWGDYPVKVGLLLGNKIVWSDGVDRWVETGICVGDPIVKPGNRSYPRGLFKGSGRVYAPDDWIVGARLRHGLKRYVWTGREWLTEV